MADERRCMLLTPRQIGNARVECARLGVTKWLDVPFVLLSGMARPRELGGHEIPTDQMNDVNCVSQFLREAVLAHRLWPEDREERWTWTIDAKRSAAEQREVLASLGYEELTPDPARLAAAGEPLTAWPADRAASILGLSFPGTRRQEFLLEIFERSPDTAVEAVARCRGEVHWGSEVFWLEMGFEIPAERWLPLARALLRAPDPEPGRRIFDALTTTRRHADAIRSLLAEIVHEVHGREALKGASDADRDALVARMPSLLPYAVAEKGASAAFVERAIARADVAARLQVVKEIGTEQRIARYGSGPEVQERLARAEDLLAKLAADPDEAVRRAVASHEGTPRATLARLATDADESVRAAVAVRRDVDAPTLEVLAGDASATVREAVALNPETPLAARMRLGQDPVASVRERALIGDPRAQAPDPALVPRATVEEIRRRVALETSDPELLVALAREPSRPVRLAAIANAALPPHALEDLATDPDGYVREAVAAHPSVPRAVWSRLAVDAVKQVRRAAARNTAVAALREDPPKDAHAGAPSLSAEGRLPPEIEEMIADPITRTRRELLRRPGLPEAVLRALVDDPDPKVRRMLAKSARTPSVILGWLAADEDESVRAAVAASKRTPLEALQLLANDDRQDVAKVAAATIAKLPKAASTGARSKRKAS